MPKVYKCLGWARRATAKLRHHTTEEVRGGWAIRKMTMEEIARPKFASEISNAQMEVLRSEIADLLASPSALYGLIRKRA